MVKRYKHDSTKMHEYTKGHFVTYEDYKALKVSELLSQCKYLGLLCSNYNEMDIPYKHILEQIRELRKELKEIKDG